MSNIFISHGKRFQWKARALPVLIDKLEICKKCKGEGYIPMYGNEEEICHTCHGSGGETWNYPTDLELEEFLQDKINEYFGQKLNVKDMFHDD